MHPSSLLSLSPSRRPQPVSVRPALDSSTLSSLAKVKFSRIVHQSRSWGSASLGRFPLLLLLPKIYGFSPVICRYHPPSLGSQYTRSRNGTKELYGVVCLAVQDGGLGSVELEERGPMNPIGLPTDHATRRMTAFSSAVCKKSLQVQGDTWGAVLRLELIQTSFVSPQSRS